MCRMVDILHIEPEVDDDVRLCRIVDILHIEPGVDDDVIDTSKSTDRMATEL